MLKDPIKHYPILPHPIIPIERSAKFFIGIIAAFAGIVAVTIGFAVWDRRTTLRPTIEKADVPPFPSKGRGDDIRIREEKLERVVKEYARVEPRMAEALRTVGLL